MIKKIKTIVSRKKTKEKLPARITNDTVAAHREKVLAGGRKLKYPLQYTKNNLVRNTIVISSVVLVALLGVIWAQLYVWKDTGDWAYRITSVVPLPVAKIDGEYVRYSDYLIYYRSTIAVLESQGRAKDGISSDQTQFQKQQAMDRALEDAYAKKIAKDKQIPEVSDKQANDRIEQQRKESGLNESSYATAVQDHLHWNMDELRYTMKSTMLRQEVAFAVDDKASDLAAKIDVRVKAGESLADIAKNFGSEVEFQDSVVVPKDNSDGGLSTAAAALDVDKTSSSVKTLSGDGYYFITRKASSNDSIGYAYIKVPLTIFKDSFKSAKENQTKMFINLK